MKVITKKEFKRLLKWLFNLHLFFILPISFYLFLMDKVVNKSLVIDGILILFLFMPIVYYGIEFFTRFRQVGFKHYSISYNLGLCLCYIMILVLFYS